MPPELFDFIYAGNVLGADAVERRAVSRGPHIVAWPTLRVDG
jgi:hypothetical protein